MKSKYITEHVFAITFRPCKCDFTKCERYIANSMEEAIEICRDRHPNCIIEHVQFVFDSIRKTTKTIQIDY